MAKFNKRISKISDKPLQNALVVGVGFGFIDNICQMFQTVFLINESRPIYRGRNLVFKENYDDLHLLTDVSHVFFDLASLNDIGSVAPVYTRWKSVVIIEGNNLPSAEYTRPLLNAGYKCYRLDGFFHPWEYR